MNAERCKWMGSGQPRVIPDRHGEDCAEETCPGCQHCPMDHCRVCGIAHSVGACPECVGEVRDDLDLIVRMHAELPAEVAAKGVEGDALSLLGPTADPEARGHLRASVAAGRVPADYEGHIPRDKFGNELPDDTPLWTVGTWAMVYRDAFGHDEPTTMASVESESSYLRRNLTEAASEPWVPFDEFARGLQECVAHLERVLHDGEQRDLGVKCMKCDKRLVRIWGAAGTEDGWRCERCQQWSNDKQYQLALKRDYIKRAEWLTDVDMAVRVLGVTAATVRSWAATKGDRPVLIRKKLHTQRTVYSVEDVQWIYACTQDTTDAA